MSQDLAQAASDKELEAFIAPARWLQTLNLVQIPLAPVSCSLALTLTWS